MSEQINMSSWDGSLLFEMLHNPLESRAAPNIYIDILITVARVHKSYNDIVLTSKMNQMNNQSVWMSLLMGVHVAIRILISPPCNTVIYDVLLYTINDTECIHTLYFIYYAMFWEMIVLNYCFWQRVNELQRLSNLHLPPGEDLSHPKTYV